MTAGGQPKRSRHRRAVRHEGDHLVPQVAGQAKRRRGLTGGDAHRYDDTRVVPGRVVDLDRAVAAAPAEGRARVVLRWKEAVEPAQQRSVQRLLAATFALVRRDAGEGLVAGGAEVEKDL